MPSLAEEEWSLPSMPGKFKDKSKTMHRQFHQCFAFASTLFLWDLFLVALTAAYLSFQSFVASGSKYLHTAWGGTHWEKHVRASAQIYRPNGLSVLVTGAAGFVSSHVSLALKKRGDGVVGLDNFNTYYDPSLKITEKPEFVPSLMNYNRLVDGLCKLGRLKTSPFGVVSYDNDGCRLAVKPREQ